MQILTVVIGIIFVLLLLSLLATTIMELIASFFSLRGRNLVKALRNMLASDDENEILLSRFQSNSLYRHLTQQYGRRQGAPPSYISAETFQSILLDVVLGDADYEQMGQKIDELPDADLRNVLKQLWRESGEQVDLFRHEVQNWYANVMDRASGWYKRNTQRILLLMGLGIAVLFNADTIMMYERLSVDRELQEKLYDQAVLLIGQEQKLTEQQQRTSSTQDPFGRQDGYVVNSDLLSDNSQLIYVSEGDTNVVRMGQLRESIEAQRQPAPDSQLLTDEELQARRKLTVERLRIINEELTSISEPLGLGWKQTNIRELEPMELIIKFLGFIVTALAISLGAPFWFDLLRKLVNIRGSGEKP